MFYKVELATRNKNFYKNVSVRNSKCGIILRDSILQIENSEPQKYCSNLEIWRCWFGVATLIWSLKLLSILLKSKQISI